LNTQVGESAALLTAVLWAFTSVFFTNASRRIGSFYVNMIRIPMALIMISGIVYLSPAAQNPLSVSGSQFLWLAISGIVGLVLGDTFLFRAYVILGPRLGTLIFASWPIMTAVISWMMLGETLALMSVAGIAVSFAGIAWVSSERRTEWIVDGTAADKGPKKLGVVLALAGALCQALGLVIAKLAMADSLEPIVASLHRMVAAFCVIWGYGLFSGHASRALRLLSDSKGVLLTLGGAITGPFLGIWMSLVAVKHAPAGVAAAIMATAPVIIIPLSIAIYRQMPSTRATIGAIITTGGIALLFLT
jgi:drug/metabolite transporter (DMT)-like permease